MDTSRTEETEGQPTKRRKNLFIFSSADGIAPATVGFLIVITAILSFVAGTRADNYISVGSVFNQSTINEELPDDLDYSTVETVFDILKSQYDGQLTTTDLLDGLKKGLAEATGDPYTTYLNAEQAKAFTDDLNGRFSGIGAEIGKEGEFVIIVAPLKGFPAEEAGLLSQDVILEIDGEDAVGLSIDEAILKIRGEEGTDVVLGVLRAGEQFEVTITRQNIVIPSVTSEITPEGIGILTITRFADDTDRLANLAVNQFIDEGVSGVILDLRNNSGGFLTTSVSVSGLWLDNLLITEQRENGGQTVVDDLKSSKGAKLGDLPTVVLINRGSASASEIVAGALQDYEAATIMGETSFGKGSVQNLEELSDGGVLKITVARWYTPKGNNIDQQGIIPDIEVVYEVSDDEEFDNQLQAAIDYLRD